jgi:hypothetical protein
MFGLPAFVFCLIGFAWICDAVLPVQLKSCDGFREGRLQGVPGAEFSIGKDREIIDASIDLNWLYNLLKDNKTWLSLLKQSFEWVSRFNGVYNTEYLYKISAMDILLKLRVRNKVSGLR